MGADARKLPDQIAALGELYGVPDPPAVTDPFEMIVFENVAYLADDDRRAAAWRRLKETVGLRPERILGAPRSTLLEVAKSGILPARRAERMREIASIAIEEFCGDLDGALDARPADAKKILKKFPSIGDPGAEKILLFSGREAVLALESNGLRVLLRLGYGKDQKSYAASYRSAQEATKPGWRKSFGWLVRAHQLLRRHGQELCKRAHPICPPCPLRSGCAYYRAVVRA